MANFKKFIDEMTMSVSQLNFTMPDFSNAKHIGDIEHHKILHYEYGGTNVYGITVEDKPVGYLQTITKNVMGNDIEEIRQVYMEPQFRGQKLATKLFFFLKSWLKKSFLAGNIQSNDGRTFIQSLSNTQRFPMFWLNVKTGEKHPYDPTTDNPKSMYRSYEQPADWQVLIEGLQDNSKLVEAIPTFLEGGWQRGIVFF